MTTLTLDDLNDTRRGQLGLPPRLLAIRHRTEPGRGKPDQGPAERQPPGERNPDRPSMPPGLPEWPMDSPL